MKSDFEIAHEATLEPIEDIAKKVNIPVGELELYGKYIAKVPYRQIDEEKVKKSKLILITAITPTKAGIGNYCQRGTCTRYEPHWQKKPLRRSVSRRSVHASA